MCDWLNSLEQICRQQNNSLPHGEFASFWTLAEARPVHNPVLTLNSGRDNSLRKDEVRFLCRVSLKGVGRERGMLN
jgi:hypothetical protein